MAAFVAVSQVAEKVDISAVAVSQVAEKVDADCLDSYGSSYTDDISQ
jgi:hypothetical protein